MQCAKDRRTLEIAETHPAPVFYKTGRYPVLDKACKNTYTDIVLETYKEEPLGVVRTTERVQDCHKYTES